MKLSTLTLLAAVALCALAGVALAAPSRTGSPKTLSVVMHDPGCHWFSIDGKLTTTASVAGPIRVENLDEATLVVASRAGTERIAVGTSIVLAAGHYRITMVGQAPDDNHLALTVS